jgi:2-polyprenyl-3-methyl-5-hydroxy-6-metoxy-1,4-benzoquinol methylase
MTTATLDQAGIQALARLYGQRFPAVRRAMVTLRPRICPFGAVLQPIAGARTLLDIGCGSGFFLFLAQRMRSRDRLVGVEASEPVATDARATLQRCLGDDAPEVAISATLDTAAWPREQFDAVTILDVLHHVPPPAKHAFLTAAAARVAPGGRLIYKDIDAAPTWRRAMNTLHDLVVARERVTYIPRDRVAGWLRQAGLVRVEARVTDTLWYRHTLDVYWRPDR